MDIFLSHPRRVTVAVFRMGKGRYLFAPEYRAFRAILYTVPLSCHVPYRRPEICLKLDRTVIIPGE